MRKLTAKIFILLIFLIVLCLVGFFVDKHLQKVDIIYAAWRQPNQIGSDWSNRIFVSRYPDLFTTLFGSLFSLKAINVNFNDANFLNGGINDTYLQNTNFVNANMENSYFIRCTFKGCNLKNADLKNATLNQTVFWDVNLRGANMEGADLRYVVFYNVDLRGANLKGVKLHLTGYDSHTKWPRGFHLNNDLILMNDPPILGGR